MLNITQLVSGNWVSESSRRECHAVYKRCLATPKSSCTFRNQSSQLYVRADLPLHAHNLIACNGIRVQTIVISRCILNLRRSVVDNDPVVSEPESSEP